MSLLQSQKIRFILSPAAEAAWNMAVDETLLWSVRQGRADLIVRFYRWDPPALSFGLFQHPEKIIDLLIPGCVPEKCPDGTRFSRYVRRMTGGKMVYHADEWTFSLMCSPCVLLQYSPTGSSLLEVFKKVMTPFLNGLAECGLKTHFAQEISVSGHDRIHCYSAAAGHSIFLDGKKLIGAAAVRKDGCLAIHGSIPITIGDFPSHLLKGGAGAQKLPVMASLSGNLPAEEIARLPEIVAKAYADSLAADIQRDSLTQREQRIAEFLAREKFSDLFWPARKEVIWDKKIQHLEAS